MNQTIEFTNVKRDINGNPRFVCHYTNLFKESEKWPHNDNYNSMYTTAVRRANKIGGRKFHNKQYGGGIVFQAYSPQELEKLILDLLNK